MAPWGPSLGRDPQECALLRFHEEEVSGRVLVTLTEMEHGASAGLFPFGSQRREEVCILWKGLDKRPGPCAQTPLPSTCSGGSVWARWAFGDGRSVCVK